MARNSCGAPNGLKCQNCGAPLYGTRKTFCGRACRSRYQQKVRHSKGENDNDTHSLVKATRRCHDCGRPTTNYRCPLCWEKRHADEGVDPDDYTGSDFGCGHCYAD